MIILQFDAAYFHWGLTVAQSLALHEGHTRLLCDVLNLNGDQIAQLEAAHPLIQVRHGPSLLPTTPERMTSRKPFVMQRAMDEYPRQACYALLDADSLVRRPLDALWAIMESHSVALYITDGYENGIYYPQLVTPSGLVIVRPEGRQLIDCWAKWIQHDRPVGTIEPEQWYWDQVTLAEARAETGIRCAAIPMDIYGDDQLRPASAIWSANVGDRKPRYYELFCEEYGRQHDALLHGR